MSLLCTLTLWLGVFPAAAQQFVTDDAAVVDEGACQVEAWYASQASWVLPACRLFGGTEITAGVGTVETGEGREARYVLQGKRVFRALEPDDWGIGVVAGFGLDPLGQIVARRIDAAFAYVPVSVSVASNRLVLHQNAGWTWATPPAGELNVEPGSRLHALTWGMRADVALDRRVTAIAEIFGQSRFFPEYQVGLRFTLIPDRLLADISYTGATAAGGPSDFTVGLAWTPAALMRSGEVRRGPEGSGEVRVRRGPVRGPVRSGEVR